MKLKTLVAALAIILGAPAFAAIAPGSTGNGELFLVVQDSVAKVSFTLDLGITMDSFLSSYKSNGYFPKSWNVAANSNWAAFDTAADVSASVWAILAVDSTGNLNKDGHRLLTTVEVGKQATIGGTSNKAFSDAMSTSQAGTFFSAINSSGSHVPQADFAINGSSVNFETDSGRAYFGEAGGINSNMSGQASFKNTNVIGAESLMFYVTRSNFSQTNASKVFSEQLSYAPGVGPVRAIFDGQQLTMVPEPGTYALMLAGLAAVGFIARRRRV